MSCLATCSVGAFPAKVDLFRVVGASSATQQAVGSRLTYSVTPGSLTLWSVPSSTNPQVPPEIR